MAGHPPSIRQAAGLLVAAFSRASRAALARGDPEPLPCDGQVVYDAAVTIIVRMATVLMAAQRGLLAAGPWWEETGDLWRHLLSTSEELSGTRGLRGPPLAARGPSLFAADRFPFLTATTPCGRSALTVPDQVMRRVLAAVRAQLGQEAADQADQADPAPIARLGDLYEGLVGYTTVMTTETIVGLIGISGQEPEIPLASLEDLARAHPDPGGLAKAVQAWCRQHQQSGRLARASRLRTGLVTAPCDADHTLRTITSDADLARRLRPYLGIAARDAANQPTIYLPGSRRIGATQRRGETGGHYTHHALADDVVRAALDRALTGPALSGDPMQIRLADIACGSGAFLLATARYLAERLVQARLTEAAPPQVRSLEAGRAGDPGPDAAQAKAAALREALTQCVYGADLDPNAVAVCKASLWLLVGDKSLPMSFLDANIRHGDALIGQTMVANSRVAPVQPGTAQAGTAPGQQPADQASPFPLHWPSAFPEVMAGGGFHVIMGNPPWVAHAGRAARPLSAARRDYYAANYASFAGYRTTHGLFMEQTQNLLRAGGVCALLVPTSVADLDGYAPARRAVTARSQPEEPMPSYGDGRFSGVFQPCMALTTTRRASPTPGQDRPWSLQSDLCADARETLALLMQREVFAPGLFGDIGLRSTPQTKRHLTPLTADPPAMVRGPGQLDVQAFLLEGRDIAEFRSGRPRVGISPALLGARGARQRDAEVLVRQTARYPIAAANPGCNFRNSLLGVFPDSTWDRDLVLGLLNSSVLRWFHYHRFRDAREGMPQVKVGHLRRYPAPDCTVNFDEIRRVARSWGEHADRQALDAMVADAYGLPHRARKVIGGWTPPG